MNCNYVKVENKINIDGKGHLHTLRSKNSHIEWEFLHIHARFISGTLIQITTRFGIEFIDQPQFRTYPRINTYHNTHTHTR